MITQMYVHVCTSYIHTYIHTYICTYIHVCVSQLAKRGLNVVLMSRSEEKLNKVATEIRKEQHLCL